MEETTEQRGLGDTVAAVAHATGIDRLAALVEQVTGVPCGCNERREMLNELVPYGPSEGAR